MKKFLSLSAVFLFSSTIAAAALTEPKVTAYVSKQKDESICGYLVAEIITTASPSTRDRTLMEIQNDPAFNSLVKLAKAAAKDATIKELTRDAEGRRPELRGKVILTVGKFDIHKSPRYGVRVSLIRDGVVATSVPVLQISCEGRTFDNHHEIWANAPGDILPRIQESATFSPDDLAKSESIVQQVGALIKAAASKVPAKDDVLSTP